MISSSIVGKAYKIKILSPEHCIKVQEALFKLGYKWGGFKGQEPRFIGESEVIWIEKYSNYLSYSSLKYAMGSDQKIPWYNFPNNNYNIRRKCMYYENKT